MKHFLIYIDSLGYEKRAEEEAKTTGRPVEDIRESYIDSIERRLKNLDKKETIKSYKKSEYGDDFVVFTDSIWNAFKTIGEVLKANLPLAIGIGFLKVDNSYLIERSTETISNLKTNIIPKYKKFYESEHGEHSLTQTFILFTPEAYEQLDSKRKCSKPYPSAEFYFIEQKEFEKELKVLGFLEKIGSQRAEYKEIEELYVAPQNYDKIKNTLKEHNIVFIIGDAEMGKTYTAIRLLWEYFKEGYEPVYIREERRREQWELIRHKTEFDGEAIYLEDPWGKIEFEKLDSLFKDIGTFITVVKRNQCKLIVTSREKVFKEFEKRKETSEDLWGYVSELKINLAYSKESLVEMLKKYIHVFEPAWSINKELTRVAFEAIEKNLRTPMSIKTLIDYSKDVDDIEGLREGIEKAAEETKKSFATEIKEMFKMGEYDKLLLLSFTYIGVKNEVAKSCYKDILAELNYDLIQARSFDYLIEEFKEVEISYGHLGYIHPSYTDAFSYALVDNGKPNEFCNNIFSKVLYELSLKDEEPWVIVMTVGNNFDNLPTDVRTELLLFLSGQTEVAEEVAEAIEANFDKHPEEITSLLLEMSEIETAAGAVAEAIANIFIKLPEKVQKILFNLSERDDVAADIAWAVANNCDKIPANISNELLFKFSENDEIAGDFAGAVVHNFDKLPEDVRIELLLKLSQKDNAAMEVAFAVEDNFDEILKEARNRLLFNLSEQNSTAEIVSRIIIHNFDELPEAVRNILITLSEKKDTADDVASVVYHNFDEISESTRNVLLVKLSETVEGTLVAEILAKNVDKLPDNILDELVEKLQEKLKFVINEFLEDFSDKINLISKIWTKFDKQFTLTVLDDIIDRGDETVKTKAKVLREIIAYNVPAPSQSPLSPPSPHPS